MFISFSANPPFNVQYPPMVMALAAFMAIGGLQAFGVLAKGREVTGGTVSQPGIPVAPVPEQPVVVVAASSLPASTIVERQ